MTEMYISDLRILMAYHFNEQLIHASTVLKNDIAEQLTVQDPEGFQTVSLTFLKASSTLPSFATLKEVPFLFVYD